MTTSTADNTKQGKSKKPNQYSKTRLKTKRQQTYGDQRVLVLRSVANEKAWKLVGRFDISKSGAACQIVLRMVMFLETEKGFGDKPQVNLTDTRFDSNQTLADAFDLDVATIKKAKILLKQKHVIISNKKGYYAFSPQAIEFFTGTQVTPLKKSELSIGTETVPTVGTETVPTENSIGTETVPTHNREEFKEENNYQEQHDYQEQRDRDSIIQILRERKMEIDFDSASDSELEKILEDTLKLHDLGVRGNPPIPDHLQKNKNTVLRNESSELVVPPSDPKKAPPPHQKKRLMVLSLQGTLKDLIHGKINYNGVDELNVAYGQVSQICTEYHAEWVLNWIKYWSDRNLKADKKSDRVSLNTLFSEKYSIDKYFDAVMKGQIK